ncbi:DUF4129 domain-containing protein [Paenarthrobacter sp. PH39-S1]|uniref:DUF4129 domain-containing protein n=1 Tax=Paenarthrobacter sp. PH39-S1 TaxID=3046204 RepID=UPI0024BB68FF|nr:DUF4129 domain-containing protein [Paenarthrobacter sp. PH39-S1]MDJ0356454.1 DUF4129 domain-containing protein [Paenarthrobacter sp. PH39-S1]
MARSSKMIVSGGPYPALVRADVPVIPGGDEARRWAQEELSKKVYQDARPGLAELILQRIVKFFRDLLNGLSAINGNLGLVLLGLLVLVLAAIAVWLVRPRLNRKQVAAADLFENDVPLTAAEHRKLAAQAAGGGDYAGAVAEQFRALVRASEERAVLDPQPGRTADEVTARLVGAFAGHRDELLASAGLFNGVRYGKAVPAAADYDRLLALEQTLVKQTPEYDDGPGSAVARR